MTSYEITYVFPREVDGGHKGKTYRERRDHETGRLTLSEPEDSESRGRKGGCLRQSKVDHEGGIRH